MRTWTRLVPAVLLALPLTVSSVRAGDAETNEQKIAQLRKDVEDLRRDLKTLAGAVLDSNVRGAKAVEDLRDIKEALQRMASAQDAVARQSRYAPLPTDELREMRDLLQRIASAQELTIRRSAYAPLPTTGDIPSDAVPVPTTGTITVRNQYTATATVRINGRAFPVGPGQTARIPGVPVGAYTYDVEVDGYGVVMPLRTETLRPNGRIITIYPQ